MGGKRQFQRERRTAEGARTKALGQQVEQKGRHVAGAWRTKERGAEQGIHGLRQICPKTRVTNSPQFALDFPGFSTESSASQKTPLSQANGDNSPKTVPMLKLKDSPVGIPFLLGTPGPLVPHTSE